MFRIIILSKLIQIFQIKIKQILIHKSGMKKKPENGNQTYRLLWKHRVFRHYFKGAHIKNLIHHNN